jgi:hypothetical protein
VSASSAKAPSSSPFAREETGTFHREPIHQSRVGAGSREQREVRRQQASARRPAQRGRHVRQRLADQ